MSLGACVACFDSTTVTGHVLPDNCFMVSPSCIKVIVICCVLTHRLCSWLVSNFSSSSLLLVSVDGALTESVNCSDVWNVSYSSSHCTTESRGGTRTSIRQNSLVSSLPVRLELVVLHHAVSGKRIWRLFILPNPVLE